MENPPTAINPTNTKNTTHKTTPAPPPPPPLPKSIYGGGKDPDTLTNMDDIDNDTEQRLEEIMELRQKIRGLMAEQHALQQKVLAMTDELRNISMRRASGMPNTLGNIAGHIGQNNES